MEFIALFIPAIITVWVRYKRNMGETWKWIRYVVEYAEALLINVILTQVTVVYILGATGEETSDFVRFAFSVKYLVIACFWAYVIPYVREALSKAIAVTVDIEKNQD